MAGSDKNDKAIDKLLSRGIRGSLDASGRDCPDPEALAAYFDRELAGEESQRWELHFSSCARCQEQLAALARAETAASGHATAAAPSAVSRFFTWRWLAPLATAAVVAAVWIGVQLQPKQVSAPVSTISENAPQAPASAADPKPAAEALIEGAARDKARREADVPKKLDAVGTKAPSTAAAGEFKDTQRMRKAAEEARLSDELAKKAAVAAPTASADKLEQVVASNAPAAAEVRRNAPPSAPVAAPDQNAVTAVQAEQKQKEQEKAQLAQKVEAMRTEPGAGFGRAQNQVAKQPAAGAVAPTQTAEATQTPQVAELKSRDTSPTARGDSRSRLEMSPASLAKREVRVKGPDSFVWRYVAPGALEKSEDSGKTWAVQKTDLEHPLFAGACTSAKVCWMVGGAGYVLRTSDGEYWEKMTAPTDADLRSIKAKGENEATVTAAGGRRYSTSDGGRNWRELK